MKLEALTCVCHMPLWLSLNKRINTEMDTKKPYTYVLTESKAFGIGENIVGSVNLVAMIWLPRQPNQISILR